MPASVHTKAVSIFANSAAQREQICAAQQLVLRAEVHAKSTSKGSTADNLLPSATAWMFVTAGAH